MHLWPSWRIRDSFKHDYLKKLEWNLHRMKSDKKSQKLLGSEEEGEVNGEVTENCQNSKDCSGFLVLFREILLVLSCCCYCCFCCGACSGQEEN